jgi:2-polyprenyl-6-methoxyphenol hydroxylase-like FAD-dependent oxidoreductase
MEKLTTSCCIAGGGTAGMMLGFLLARAGVDVLVLEKHADFLRDFRGDTIHPSTLEVMHELGVLDDFLKLPHQEARLFEAQFGDTTMTFADFTRLPTHCQFIAFMPQWDFLNFMVGRAARYPTFKLRMSADVTDLIEESGRVVGVRQHQTARSKCVQISSSVPTAAIRSCARRQASRSKSSAPRWTCCGFGFRVVPAIPRKPSAVSA